MATAAASPHVQSKSSPTLGRPAPPRRTTGLAVAVGGSGVFVAVAAPGVAVGLKIMVTTGGLVSVGVADGGGVFVGRTGVAVSVRVADAVGVGVRVGVLVTCAGPRWLVGVTFGVEVLTGTVLPVGLGVFVGVAVGPACDSLANVAVGALKMTVVSSHAHHETTNKERLTATGP